MNMEEEILEDTSNYLARVMEKTAPNGTIPGLSNAQSEALLKIIKGLMGEAARYSHRQTILKIYDQVKNRENTIQ